jgi:hypothetical protein
MALAEPGFLKLGGGGLEPEFLRQDGSGRAYRGRKAARDPRRPKR